MKARKSAAVGESIRKIVLSQFRDEGALGPFAAKPGWAEVKKCGTELWLDTGDMEEISALWCPEFTAVTTNNTLLNKEVQKGIYDKLISTVAGELRGQVAGKDMALEIAFVLNAVHGLRLSRRFGAKVSVELHTDLAHDVDRAVAYGLRYHAIAPDRFYVKVPLTAAGLLATRRLSEQGVAVNFTLGFSARQNHLIAAIARPAFVNVFLGRLNSYVGDQNLGSGKFIGEKATLASNRAVRAARKEFGVPTRQIAASLRDGIQVAALIGTDVLTMPPKVAHQFEELRLPPGTVSSQAENDPRIELAPDVCKELRMDVLWDVPENFKQAVRDFLSSDLSRTSPDGLRRFFAERGFADLLPDWSPADIQTITADGKIPRHERWRDRIASGQVGLDALLNLAGLQSFTTDQKAMDDRIKSMLHG